MAPKDEYWREKCYIRHDFDGKVSHLYDRFSYLFKLKCYENLAEEANNSTFRERLTRLSSRDMQ